MDARNLRIALIGFVLAAMPAAAQTRTSEIEASRGKKAVSLQSESVSRFENIMLQFKQRKIMERVAAGYNGLRIQIGGMATGSGFAMGPDFRREDLSRGQVSVNASAVFSTRRWQKYEVGFAAPHMAGDHLSLQVEAVRRDYRSLEFSGTGINSSRDNLSNYRLEDTSILGLAAFRPIRFISIGGGLGTLWTKSGPGKRNDIASTETIFTDADAPGFGNRIRLLHSNIFGQIDYRDNPAGPKSGGNYVIEHTWFNDRSGGSFGFGRLDIDIQQYIPFFNKTRRLALRARFMGTERAAGQRVPFHLQPAIGGSDDLRGYRPFRFSGPNAVVYNAEYRWEVFSGLDGALFVDAGKVMAHRGHLALTDLKVSPGFGLRFNARNRTFIRLDVGFSNEGTYFWLKFNDPFLPRLFGAATRQPAY